MDGNNDGTAVVDMGAYEFFPATATVSPTILSFPDQAFGSTSSSQPVTVTNTGSSTLLLDISTTGDFVQTNNCGSGVAAGKSCAISVSFKPITRGTLTGKLTVVSNTTKSPAVVSLSGTGIGPAASISPLNVDFGNQLQGTTSSAQTVTVTNVGELPLSFTSIFTKGDFAQTNTCTGGIATGASCTVSVTFTPTATGKSVGSLTFTDNAADSPQAVVLTGTGSINPVPLLNEPVVPSSAAPGSSSFTLTVHGTAFVSGATVDWNGTLLTTTFVNGSELKATVPASDVAAATTASITVANPGPAWSTSNVVFFPVGTQVPSVSVVTSPASQYGVGNNPEAVATGDFNNDGRLDMAVTAAGGNYVTILLGNGDGTFTETSSGPLTGVGPNSVVVGDFNNDGNLDLAVTNGAGNSVSILLGHGNGSFTAAGSIPVGTDPDAIAAGDFNGDGNLDLAVADRGSNRVIILLGNGDGTFTATGSSIATGTYPDSIAVGDFDGNGTLDLAVANKGSNNVTVLLGNGDGTFTPAAPSATGAGPDALVTADFDGDGKLDLAVANATDNTVSILHGNGDGTFTAIGSPIATGKLPNGLTVGDYTDDGKLDLAVADNGSNSVTILRGNGDGTFTAVASSLGTGAGPWAVVAGDFNGDGRLDLATANSLANTVSILLQGQASGLTLSPSSLNFSSQVVGTTSSAQPVTLTNNSAAAVAISIKMSNSDFAEANTCGSSVAAASSCTINVTFDPTAGGSRVGTLSISDNASSNSLEVALSGTGEDFSISAQSTSATVSAGGTASYDFVLAPKGGFSGDVSLSCSGVPAKSTCSISPASVTLSGSSSADVTVKVATNAASDALPIPFNPPEIPPTTMLWACLASLIGFGVLVRFLPSRVRTRARFLAPLVVVLMAITFWTACGGGGGSTAPSSTLGTPAGTYALTVTGKSGNLTQSTTVSLTVQ